MLKFTFEIRPIKAKNRRKKKIKMAKFIKIPKKGTKRPYEYSREHLLFFGAFLWPINSESWRKLNGTPSLSTVRKIFGSWENFREEIKDGFEEDGIEIKMMDEERKPYRFYSNKSDEELKSYTRENHRGSLLSQLHKESRGLYDALGERNLLEPLVEEGTLERKHEGKPCGFYSNKSDEELKSYTRENHRGSLLSQLQRESFRLYENLRERNLLEPLVEEGTLERKIAKKRGLKEIVSESLELMIDSEEKLREVVLEKYVELFWDDPLSEKSGKKNYRTKKTLQVFVHSRDLLSGVYKGRGRGTVRYFEMGYYNSKERKQGISFFDYMTQGLDPDLIERVRKIDSGERVDEYLAEQLGENIDRYLQE